MASIADLRREYAHATLSERDVDPDPIRQFGVWWEQALAAEALEPNAMTLVTASADGMPNGRIVLLKGYDPRGFVFYTDYRSRKGLELAENPRAALVFYWKELERQVRIGGAVERTSVDESAEYFRSRPRGSRLGAWTSFQSQVIPSRDLLEARLREVEARFGEGEVPLPDHWGGYRVVPNEVEFWQGRPSRLHDRLRYVRDGETAWRIERLSP